MASHASTAISLTQIAGLLIPCLWNRWDAFRAVKSLRTYEFDFWCPDSTCDVDPIVVGCALKGLAWELRSVHLHLSPAVEFGSLSCHFAVHALLFTVLLRLLLMGAFRWFNEVVFRRLHRAQRALVILHCQPMTGYVRKRGELTIDTCGFLSFRQVSQAHLPGPRVSPTTP